MHLIVLCGLSGSGKSFLRESSAELRALPFLDMADYHAKGYVHSRGIDKLIADIVSLTGTGAEGILVEGWFLPGSPGRDRLKIVACGRLWTTEFRMQNTAVSICRARLQSQIKNSKNNDERQIHIGRLTILDQHVEIENRQKRDRERHQGQKARLWRR